MRCLNLIAFVILVFSQFEKWQAVVISTCSTLEDGSLKMEMRTNDYASLMGYDPVTSTPTKCLSVSETVNGTVYQVFTVITNTNRVQTSPANLTTHNCYVKPSAADTNAVDYKVLGLTQAPTANGTLINPNDRYYNVTCDPDNGPHSEVITAAGMETQLTINSENIAPTRFTIEMTFVNYTTGVALTPPAQIGTEFKVKIVFTRTLSANAVPVGLNGHTMQVSAFANFTPGVVFLDQNGCPVIQFNEAQRAGIESGFVVDTTNTDPTKFIVHSGKMFFSGFLGGPKMYYMRVRYQMCYDANDNKCSNIVAYCAAQGQGQTQGRKRRSSGNIPDTGDLTTSIELAYGSETNQGGVGEGNQAEPTCGEIYKFWILSSVLGGLLLLAMCFAIYLYFRLRNEQMQLQKMANKYGVSNSALET